MTASPSSAVAANAARADPAPERCPLCDQPIPNEKLAEVAARQGRYQAEVAGRAEKKFEEKAKIDIERVMAEAAARELTARADGEKAARDALEAKLTDIEAARASAEERAGALQLAHEALLEERLADERRKLAAEKDAEINALRLKAMEEKFKIEAQVQDLQRKLQNKTAAELGDGPEFDLFEDLKRAFVEDRIARVEKGAAGADIIHDVYYNGRLCGRIVYDAKNRNTWRNDYTAKLRQDQIAAEAAHAVLSSRVFPANARELYVQDGVIVVHPARVTVLAELLRNHVVQTHALRASNEARAHKTAALYEFINSEACKQLLDSAAKHAGQMLALDAAERKSHEKTWKERDKVIRSLQRVQGQFTSEVERILGVAGDASGDVEGPADLEAPDENGAAGAD